MKLKSVRITLRVLVRMLMTAAIMTLLVFPVAAKDENRVRFYGWIKAMPDGLHGTWQVGGRTLNTGPGTDFDQTQGDLVVGGCAKVDIRGGMVHEIDSEPASDCR